MANNEIVMFIDTSKCIGCKACQVACKQWHSLPSESDLGKADSSSSTTLIDGDKTWTANQWAGFRVQIIAGTGHGQTRTISSNDATTLTISSAWSVDPDSTSVYSISRGFNGSYTNPPDFSGDTLTVVRYYENSENEGTIHEKPQFLFLKDQCRHCFRPKCARACPQGVTRTDEGFVLFNSACTESNLRLKVRNISGWHLGPDNSADLVDKKGRNLFLLGVRVGSTIKNTTKSLTGTVTAIKTTNKPNDTLTASVITDWDIDDRFKIEFKNLADFCPYNVPRFSNSLKMYVKCDFCYDRFVTGRYPKTLKDGKFTTACEFTCPTGAITTGSYNDINTLIRARYKVVKRIYPLANVYRGRYGRTNVVYLLTDVPSKYGMISGPS